MNIIIISVIMALVLIIGGGIGYWIWLGTRPKKLIWRAKVYQLGEGIMPPIEKNGKVIADYKLTDLREYASDIVEQIITKGGGTRYWLRTLKKSVPVVTADCVEKWGKDKFVSVLLHGDTCTLLKCGYDKKTAHKIFIPMDADRINMIKTESEERKARVETNKDILSAIAPFIITGLWIMGLVAITYIVASSMIEIGKQNNEAAIEMGNKIEAIKQLVVCDTNILLDKNNQVVKEDPPELPP